MTRRTLRAPTLSCVMPAYNEGRNLATVVPQVLAALQALSPQAELVLVNDGSRDDTAAVARALCRAHPGVVLIDLSRNFGKEAALTAGLDAARGEVVVLMDADGQHPISMLPEMLLKWEQGSDVVYAVRRTRHDQSALHARLTRIFYRLINWGNRVEIPPNAGDFRLMDRKVVEAL
ncbi:MAG: glycosyltransferase family 2 protein, partial [Burkholderiaceae bacterium]|nr:glycosyltransferase family 2 protein [Burkholderiaceae bacterium]